MPKVFDHEKSRSLVCLVCRKKIFANGRKIINGSNTLAKIRKLYKIFEQYDPEDMTVPNSLCSNCLRGIYRCTDEHSTPPRVMACAYFKNDKIHTRGCVGACNICTTARQRFKSKTVGSCSCSTCMKYNGPPKAKRTKAAVAPKKTQISAKDLIEIQSEQHCSNTQIRKLSSSIRKLFGRSAVQPEVMNLVRENSSRLEEFFTTTTTKMHVSESSVPQERIIVHCIDIEALLMHIIKEREYNPFNHLVRIGLDGGQTMFKLVMNIINTTDDVQSDQYKDSGVRKTCILAVVEGIKENYENVNTIISSINNFDRIKYFICSDLKLINIICGIQSCSSKHPCPYCLAESHNLFSSEFPKRSVKSISDSSHAFKRAGSVAKDSKMYGNCINLPLLPGCTEEFILDVCAPPQLHMLQGIVKHVYDNIYKEWPGVAHWLAEINIKQKNYHNGTFVGNDCMLMLKKLDKLQQMAPLCIQKYVHLLSFSLNSKQLLWDDS